MKSNQAKSKGEATPTKSAEAQPTDTTVAVGNALAGVPPRRSVLGELPDTAPTLGHGGVTANSGHRAR